MVSKLFVEELIATPFVDSFTPQHQLGPDYIIQTNASRTWVADGAVSINLPQNVDPQFLPKSVISAFRTAVENSPNKPALVVQRNGVLTTWSYTECWQIVKDVAKGFIKLGLIPFHAVGILSVNSPEWTISYLAAIFCGGFAAGIYITNSPAACFHVLESCSANLAVVENKEQLNKILSIRDKLPHLKAIVQMEGNSDHPDVISWQDLILIGQSLPDIVLEKRMRGIAINQCCTLIYTSGTTGNPKGVMISHDSVLTSAKTVLHSFMSIPKYGKVVSYLPFSHVAALIFDMYLPILTESAVHFANPDALKGKLVEDLLQAQPTYFVGVPRVFEKMKEKLQAAEESLPALKKKLMKWAHQQAYKYHQQVPPPTSKPLLYLTAVELVLKKIKIALGLQNVKFFGSGGAPLSQDVYQFFQSCDIVLHDGFGISECSGGHLGTRPEICHRIGSVGNVNVAKDFETKIINPDIDGSGEMIIRGRHVFMGYLGLEEMTKNVLMEDKWFHTGDMGIIDKDGFLFITGRIKELIVTSGGENIPPVLIEEQIKKLLPVLSSCMLIGDRKKYLTILLTLKTEVNLNTLQPIDDLNPIAIKWCQSVGSSVKRLSEILQSSDPNITTAIQQAIDKYNNDFAVSRAQKIQKWTILPQDFCIQDGTLGPTNKLKRPFVVNKYSRIIESMYAS